MFLRCRGRVNRVFFLMFRFMRENKGELNVLIYVVVNLFVRIYVVVCLFNN